MRFVDSRCIHCGATLRVARDAAHICCQYCKAELIVVRDGAAVTTQMLGEMNENLGQKLDVLRMQNEVERLDREWSLQRETFMVSGQNGARSLPSTVGSIFGGGIMIAMGSVMFLIIATAEAPPFVILMPVVMIGAGIVTAFFGMSKASAHRSAEAAYQRRRQVLLRELARVQR